MPTEEAPDAERFPRSRFLERATLGLGGLVAAGVALPALAGTIVPSFRTKRRPIAICSVSFGVATTAKCQTDM